MSGRTLDRLAPWLAMTLLLVGWELATIVFDIDPFILPSPSLTIAAIYKSRDALLHHSLVTLFTTVVGFAIGVGFGIVLGILIGASRFLYNAVYPLLIGFNSVPKVAIVPILVIWFGVGMVPAILTAFLLAFFPIVVNVAVGIATIEPELRDVLRSLGARQSDILLKIGIPRSLPFLFASLKIAITLAFVGSVISESLAGSAGIGYVMLVASSRFDVPLVFAGVVVIAAMGIGMYALFAAIEGRFTGWATRSMDYAASGG